MTRFDLLDEYTSIVMPGMSKTGREDWPERFEDSYPGVLQETGRTERSMTLGGLFLFTIAGTVVGLIRKDFL